MDKPPPAPSLGSEGRAHIKLACVACQRKKIRCDRTFPCGQCEKSSLTCVPSTRKARTRSVGKKAVDSELRSRIAKLETLVETLSGESGGAGDSVPGQEHGQDAATMESEAASSPFMSKLIGMPFWSTLTSEVHALRDALEEDEYGDNSSFEPRSSAAMTAEGAATADLLIVPPASLYIMPGALLGPSVEMESELYRIYFEYVDPVFKVLHRPSMRPFLEFGDAYLGENADSPPNTALRSAMWFASTTTLPESDNRFDKPRSELIGYFRRLCDVALARADWINTCNMATLQAAAIYVAASRLTDPGKKPWTLTALVVRIAQGMNLQHESPGHTPYEKELRRRLWDQIRILDTYSSIDRGSEILLPFSSFTTPPPSHVNDEDFDESTTIITSRESGLSDMTFTVMANRATSLNMALLTKGADSWQMRYEKAELFGKEIQERYLRFCDKSQPFHRFLLLAGRGMTTSTILRAVRPMQKLSGSTPPRVDSPFVLQLAVNCLQACEDLHEDSEAVAYRWLYWVKWHAFAVALAGLCSLRDTELVRNAWTLVEKQYERNSSDVADSRNGMLWRPIEKLYRKAVAFRDGVDAKTHAASSCNPPVTRMAGLEIKASDQTAPPLRAPTQQPNRTPGPFLASQPTYGHQWPPNRSSVTGFSGNLPNIADFADADLSWMDWEQLMEDISNMPTILGPAEPDHNATAPNIEFNTAAMGVPPDLQGGWTFGPQ